MKTFAFRGFDRSGARTRGMIEALHLKDAREKLAARGVLAEELTSASSRSTLRRNRFKAETRASLYRELGALLRAGVPAVGALDLLIEAHPEPGLSAILAGVRDRLREGEGFAQAMAETGREISAFEIALLQTGTRTGQLGAMLDQMAGYLEDQLRLREGILSALLYPLLVVVLALLIGVIMVTTILPRLSGLFAESGVALPAATKALIWFGGDGRVPLLITFLLVCALVAYLIRKATRPEHRIRWERRILRLPLFRRGYRLVVSIRFTRTLVMLLRGGVPMVEGLPLAGEASGSAWLAQEIARGNESVRQGRSVAEVIAESPWIGTALPAWYRAGEASGDLDGLLEQAAHRFQEQWETLLQRFIRMVEPALILIVGLFVLLVALAILQPILSLNQMAR
ncbi:MAG: type II secretion system F family protein [Kiritimatiellae bacterium]|nr:type II secretion system F family protein [Kiritimatiellia bacterium]